MQGQSTKDIRFADDTPLLFSENSKVKFLLMLSPHAVCLIWLSFIVV